MHNVEIPFPSCTLTFIMPTVFLSAATIDLEPWRDVLDNAFSRAGFRVLKQKRSLGVAAGDVRRLLAGHIDESDCVIHLAGLGYGSDAQDPFPDTPEFVCSWTQFEYYYAHAKGKDVIAFVCAPDLSRSGFVEDQDATECERKRRLQAAHRERVASGKFDGTPLAGRVKRTSNETVDDVKMLLQAVAAAVGTLHRLDTAGVKQQLDQQRNLYQLPSIPVGFVGRETDLATLRRSDPVGGTVITGLRGMGGIGKTALATVLAHGWRDRFPDAQLWLDARGTQPNPPSAAALLEQALRAFDPISKFPEDEAALRALYHQTLANRRVLIVVDNAADAAQVKPLTPPAGCGLIVTSRRNFLVGTTAAYFVGRLPDDDAAALLREYHAGLTDAEAAELVRWCAGLPLALRLAGAHLTLDAADRGGVPDVEKYLTKLRRSRLATLDRDADDAAEVTIAETLRLSEELLPDASRRAWRALGIFTASFDSAAAHAIIQGERGGVSPPGDSSSSLSDTEDLLVDLVRRSLLEQSGDRYRMHDLAAEYAEQQLDPPTRFRTHLAHAEYFTKVGAQTDDIYLAGDPVGGLDLFDAERAQIEASFAWLTTTDLRSEAEQAQTDGVLLALINGIAYTSNLRFHPWQQIAWLEAPLDAARRLGRRYAEGNVLGSLGNAYFQLGDASRAIDYHEQALAIFRETGDRHGEKNALGNLGNAHLNLGDAHRAIKYHKQALVISREIGDQRVEGNALGNLGLAHANLGDAHTAIKYHKQALVISREIGDRHGEGKVMGNLGNVYADLGDSHRAIKYHEQALVISREIGDHSGEASDLWNLAVDYWKMNSRPEAIARAEAALALFEAIEDPHADMVRQALAEWHATP